ncbi:MAG: carotenoid biosynthesis protein [candidate division NC10 bacterium]|nr:carotenoid biosynthesis protein [candidate division NC10 bacterium]
MESLKLLFSTLILRPYVSILFAIFFTSAVQSWGWMRTFIFTLLGWGVAFAAEFSSTRTGFPFGFYSYIPETKGRELWILNVPFMDSFSFVFLAYASYTLALHLLHPSWKGLQRWRVLFLATLLFVLLDVIIDPLALRGDRWFLGKIYGYPEGGIYFGVPLSNFLGWGVVGSGILGLFEAIDRSLGGVPAGASFPGLGGPFLYFLVLLSGVGMTFWIGEPTLGAIGLGLSALPLGFFVTRLKVNQRWNK